MELEVLNILAVGRHTEIMEVLARLLNARDKWKGTVVVTDEDALEAIQAERYTIVLLCSGIAQEEEEKLRQQLLLLQPDVIILQHYGGGSGLLYNEIYAALDAHHITLK